MKYLIALLLALAPAGALAQTPNVTPQALSPLDAVAEVDIRLRGAPTSTSAFPIVRTFTGVKFSAIVSQNYSFTAACWNTTTTCPQVVGVTVRVFFNIGGVRTNVTGLSGLCGTATECVLPPFQAIAAKPGESYKFRYSRINAAWNEPPSIIPTPTETGVTSR